MQVKQPPTQATPQVRPLPGQVGHPDPQADWVDIGKIGRPHGVRGDLKVLLFNPDMPPLEPGMLVRPALRAR